MPLHWQRQRWQTPDQDFIDIDWLPAAESANEAPLLVLFHGLEGSSQSHYAKALAHATQRRNWTLAVVHFRGCSGELNHAPRAYHSGDSQEIDWILRRMQTHTQGPRYAIGVSLGGNALMRWAGETAEQASPCVQAVASVCAPLDLVASGMALGKGWNRYLYTPMFLRTMKRKAKAKWQQHPGRFDLQRALRARTLFEFDDAFTAPVHGFAGVMDYWQRASAKPLLHQVAIAALVLHARNDPFVPAQSWPQPSEISETVTLWQPEHGGHVGFASGRFPGELSDMPERIMNWFSEQHTQHHG